jgi:hypothetical protein
MIRLDCGAITSGTTAAINGSRAAINGSRAAINGSRAAINGSRAAINGSRAAKSCTQRNRCCGADNELAHLVCQNASQRDPPQHMSYDAATATPGAAMCCHMAAPSRPG